MIRVKICGITNLEDARAAIDYGADALGFIFVPNTPRYVGQNPDALHIPSALPPFVSRVAVCKEAQGLQAAIMGFDTLQIYNPLSTAPSAHHRQRLIRAFRVQDETTLEAIEAELKNPDFKTPDAIHLDTYHKDKLGGAGETFNWELALEAKRRFSLPIILAGGLTPDNVEEAITTVQPYAVDVSSGVEAEPGRKDHTKLRAFFHAVHRAGK